MKKILLFTLSLVLVGFAFQACSSDDGTEKPIISNLEPAEGDSLQIGQNIHFSADISASSGLKSYKIDIHNNFDGHAHTKGVEDSIAYSFTKVWTTDKTDGEALSGKKNTTLHHHEIEIPILIEGKPVKTGKYHFILYVVDQERNETLQAKNVILTYNNVKEDHD